MLSLPRPVPASDGAALVSRWGVAMVLRSKLLRSGIAAAAIVALSAGVASAGAAPDPADVLQGNMVWNGGFDVADYAGHPLGWSVEGNEAGVNVVNRGAFRTQGLTSLQFNDVAGSAISVRSKRGVAVPNVEYSLAFDLKGEGASGAAPTATIEFWGMPVMPAQQGPLLDSKTVAPAYSTDWQHVDLTAVAPVGTIQVSVVFKTTAVSTGTNHFDQVTLDDAPPAYDPAVGTDRELLVDDYRIESMDDVGRVVHPAVKDAEPMIVADKPWEKTVYYPHIVKPAGGRYRMYYTCYNDIPPNYHVCLAESRDFEHWTKPNLGLVDFEGSTANNIVPVLGSVTYNPDAPADRRYTSLYFGNGTTFGYHGQISADGLHWAELPGVDPLIPGGDVVNLTYDEVGKQYIATYKDRLFQSDTPGTYDRSAFISTSKDFLHWTPETLAVSGDVADDGVAYSQSGLEGQIYGMPAFHYGNQYIAMPWKFSITDFSTGIYASAGDGTIAPSLATSRDLLRWDQAARGSILEPGDPGSWNDGTLYTDNYLKITDKAVEMTYGGFNTGHGGAVAGKTQHASIGKATWRRDGFVSISNAATPKSGDAGSITTTSLTFTGKSLHLNTKVRPRGEVEVEVLDPATNEPLPGYTAADAQKITGDRLDAVARWRGGKTLTSLNGRQVKLKIYLSGADLYSYWFTK